jgi:hypothetical protein
MTKKEWIDVLDSAYEKAKTDHRYAEPRTPEEYISRLCRDIFYYLRDAIKELE